MTFAKWFETFLTEKNVNMGKEIVVSGPSGQNYMTVQTVVDAIKATGKGEQSAIKTTLVKIDFANGSVTHYFNHLAQALAI